MNSRTSFGFTLIELLVVISIIALLSSVVVSTLTTARVKARDASRIANARQLSLALEQYEMTNGTYAVAGAGYQGTGSGYASYVGGVDYTTSIVSALKSSGTYSSSKLSDPLYGDQNYFIGRCTTTLAYTLFLKVEQEALKQDAAALSSGCDGGTAVSLGFNYVAGGNGAGAFGGSVAGGGGGGGSTSPKISIGYSHAMALAGGALYAWGNDDNGTLGISGVSSKSVPTRIGVDSDWKEISATMFDSFAIKNDGRLFATGYNNHGQLGFGDVTQRDLYAQVGSDTWSTLVGGQYYTLGIQTNGTLWAWGYGQFNSLGLATTSDILLPTQIGTANDWKSVSAGFYSSAGIKNDGSLWVWGYNANGQLGLNNTTAQPVPVRVGSANDWKKISMGYGILMAIKNDGTLWACGDNTSGRLGFGDTTIRRVLTQLGTDTWTDISVGNGFQHGVKSDGTLWAWGVQGSSQLGLGDAVTRTVPTQVGSASDWKSVYDNLYASVIAQKIGDTLYSWGYGGNGVLGLGNFSNFNLPQMFSPSW